LTVIGVLMLFLLTPGLIQSCLGLMWQPPLPDLTAALTPAHPPVID